MRRESFGHWGENLAETDFWKAVAALGCLDSVVAGAWREPQRGEVERSLDTLRTDVRQDRRLRWTWSLPGGESIEPLQEREALPAEFWLDVWTTLSATAPHGRPRLALATVFDNQTEFIGHLLNGPADAAYVERAMTSAGWNWQWPVRFGFLDDAESLAWLGRFRFEYERHASTRRIAQASAVTEESEFDLLVVPASLAGAARRLRSAPVAVRANGIVILQDGPVDWRTAIQRAEELLGLTGASGVLIVTLGEHAAEQYLHALLVGLSHDLPLDQAAQSKDALRLPVPSVIYGSAELVDGSRISRHWAALAESLIGREPMPLEVPGWESWRLGLPPGPCETREVGRRMRAGLQGGPFLFLHESEGASYAVLIQRAAASLPTVRVARGNGGSPGRDAARHGTAPPSRRVLQARVVDETDAARATDIVRAGASYFIDISIGTPVPGALAADRPFPDGPLPPSGSLLTVVLIEPKLAPEPQVRMVHLPPSGPSETARFRLRIAGDSTEVDGRIAVLYRNRILQTARLRGRVGEPLTLKVEMVVRPGMANLAQQPRAGFSLLLNHTADGESRATAGAGYAFATFSLKNLDQAIELIEARINGTPWDDPEYAQLEAGGTEKLLGFLACHGSALYREFLRYSPDPERLAQATFIQVVANEHGARLPIEFFYDRKAPRPGAKLCPHARAALVTGECTTCEARDEDGVICPLAFWCFRKVIEWHRFRAEAQETRGRAYALRDVPPGERPESLPALDSALLGASTRVDAVVQDSVQKVRQTLHRHLARSVDEAANWEDWRLKVEQHSPAILVLLPHTAKDEQGSPVMEIRNDWLRSLDITQDHVLGPAGKPHPVVLLLGCNTDNAGVPFEDYVAYLEDSEAAVVVSSISKVLGRHAAVLACVFIEKLIALKRDGSRCLGEVMLEVRRKAMVNGPPVALVLKSYGDADWRW